MKSFGERLRWALGQTTLSQGDLARVVGIKQPSINHLLSPKAKKSGHTGQLAKALGVNETWLATGKGNPKGDDPMLVRVVGYVGAGARVFAFDDHAKGAGFEKVPPPPGYEGSCVAVRVRGDSMYPQIEDGWLIYYAKDVDGVPSEVIGKLCVVQVADDGPMLVKKLAKAPKNKLFRLDSINAPPMEDIRLEWATPVIAIVPK